MIEICTLAERPELGWPMDALTEQCWPEFMLHDMHTPWYFDHLDEFDEYVLIAFDDTEPDVAVARGFSVPFARALEGRDTDPPHGWDQVVRWGRLDLVAGRPTDTVSALEIAIRPADRSKGLAPRMVEAMRENSRRLGADLLVAPVRPNRKHAEPFAAMDEYVARRRPDGSHADPWLRVHEQLGGVIRAIAPVSMVIAAPLADWRAWTGLPFDAEGPVVVDGALVPVRCDPANDHAVYVEPNVWVHHRL